MCEVVKPSPLNEVFVSFDDFFPKFCSLLQLLLYLYSCDRTISCSMYDFFFEKVLFLLKSSARNKLCKILFVCFEHREEDAVCTTPLTSDFGPPMFCANLFETFQFPRPHKMHKMKENEVRISKCHVNLA